MRIFQATYDLLPSPAYTVIRAAEKFATPTPRVHQLWQTDFTYIKVIGWGWYYLASVLDDYSRYIIAWKLYTSMEAADVKDLLEEAIRKTGVEHAAVKYRPRLLSDNGSCYISKELAEYLQQKGMGHSRGKPFHPTTQGKIERYHRSMKNVINLQKYYFPWEVEQEIGRFVEYYNNERSHESLTERHAGGCVLRPAQGDRHAEGTDKAKDTEAEEALQLDAQGRRITTTTNSQTIHNLRPQSVRNFLTTYMGHQTHYTASSSTLPHTYFMR